MTSRTEQSDLRALEAKIALLEKQVADQQDMIKARESLIYNKDVQLQKIAGQLHQLQTLHFGSSSERYVSQLDSHR